jgi:hypothetical protein
LSEAIILSEAKDLKKILNYVQNDMIFLWNTLLSEFFYGVLTGAGEGI